MHEEPKEFTSEVEKALEKLSGMTITRSILHKGRMAPSGCAFFIVKYKDKGSTKTMWQTINTRGMTAEDENVVKQQLVLDFKKHFKL